MDATLVKALLALMPTSMLFAGSLALFLRGKSASAVLQLTGTGCLLIVVATHLFEALHLFPWMAWGGEHSIGHYLDLGSAAAGLTLFPLGYLLQGLAREAPGSA